MAKGDFYPIYTKVWIYSDAASANGWGSNYGSTLEPNTGSDSGTYNAVSNVVGKGNAYVDTAWGMDNPYYPAFPVWWIPSSGGAGYNIGWTRDDKNGFPAWVGTSSGAKRAKAVWVGTSSGPKKVFAMWVGTSSGTKRVR